MQDNSTPEVVLSPSTYRRSQSIAELAKALVKAQKVITAAPKESLNPHFGSKYADLASVWSACRGPLTENGLAITQFTSADQTSVTVTTLLLHESGEYLESSLTLKPQQFTPQGMGSAITYGRRYSLAAIVGVVADEDDDGERASSEAPATRPKVSSKSGSESRRTADMPNAKPNGGVHDEKREGNIAKMTRLGEDLHLPLVGRKQAFQSYLVGFYGEPEPKNLEPEQVEQALSKLDSFLTKDKESARLRMASEPGTLGKELGTQ